MSSNSPATWTNQTSLVQLPPEQLKASLSTLKSWVDTADSVLSFIEGLLNLAAGFVGSPVNLILDYVRRYSDASIKVLKDISSFGGGMIIITPLNRANPRYVDILPHPYALSLPAMTPEEAFNEFYSSFNNKNDPNRPIWTTNTEVAGLGFLLVAPDPSGLCQLSSSLSMLFNLQEFVTIGSEYSRFISNWTTDLSHQGVDYLSIFTNENAQGGAGIKFDVTGFPDLSFSYDPNQEVLQNGINYASGLLVKDSTFQGTLHWYGLSLDNFVWFKKTIEILEELIDKLIGIAEATTNAILETIRALISKIKTLRALILQTYNVIAGVLVSLSNQGLYYFNVPRGYGGVAYVQDSIQSSLSNPRGDDAKKVASLLKSSQFSALFFMGTSTGFNMDAWSALFQDTFNASSKEASDLKSLANPQFSVIPDVTKKVFSFGESFVLKVVSITSPVEQKIGYYYTYAITDSLGKVVSEWQNTGTSKYNWAEVGLTEFKVKIDYPEKADRKKMVVEKYNLQVVIFDETGKKEVGWVLKPFVVSNTLEISSLSLTDNTPTIAITTKEEEGEKDSNPGITASILDTRGPAGGTPTEKIFIPNNTTGNVGNSISASSTKDSVLSIILSNGDTVNLPITNAKGKTIAEITSIPGQSTTKIPSSFKLSSYPASLNLNFNGAIKYRKKGSLDWIYLTLPDFLSLDADTTYEYYLFIDGNWSDLMTFATVTTAIKGTMIC